MVRKNKKLIYYNCFCASSYFLLKEKILDRTIQPTATFKKLSDALDYKRKRWRELKVGSNRACIIIDSKDRERG